VINPRFTKPLDEATHEFFAKASDVVITLEDHVLPGGYGSSVMELLADRNVPTPVARIGWPDQFIEHASSVDYLRKKYGLTVERTVQLAREKAGQNLAQARLQFASA
jgi:1-deoxy-D-xylulose-5-phosphate synthase